MGDVVIVDTSVFGALNRENSGPLIANDLQSFADRGDELIVAAFAYEEILLTRDPAFKQAQLQQILDFGMKIQEEHWDDRNDMAHDAHNLPPRQQGVQRKDLGIVADVRGYQRRNPGRTVKLFTVDRMVLNQNSIQRDYGIRFSEKSRGLTDLGKRVIYYHPKPVSTAAKPSTPTSPPAGALVPPRISRGDIKVAALNLSGSIVVKIARYFGQKWIDKINEQRMNDALKRVAEEMVKFRYARQTALVDTYASSGQAYVVAMIEIDTNTAGAFAVYVGTYIREMFVSSKRYDGEIDYKPGSFGAAVKSTHLGQQYNLFYVSSEEKLTQEAAMYRALMAQINAVNFMLQKTNLTHAQYIEAINAREDLYKLIDRSFGMTEFQPDPALWTDDGYRNVTTKVIPEQARVIYGGGERELRIMKQ
jgi:hypothetical protein